MSGGISGNTSTNEKKETYMGIRSFDVLVAKEIEVKTESGLERRTLWNRVGRAWPGKSLDVIGIELYLFPGQRYVLHMGEKPEPRKSMEEAVDWGGDNE
jgi:hypothetical protein